jgi:hypothetical protein
MVPKKQVLGRDQSVTGARKRQVKTSEGFSL